MGLFLKKILNHASIGIWEISESVEDLYAQIELTEKEERIFSCLKTSGRKSHWLSYRLILPYLVHEHELSHIEYDEYGKPFLNNGVRHISVSHSGKFSCLIASPNYSVGIDIEHIEDKIERLGRKFLNEKEIQENGYMPGRDALYVFWAAKEALYKLHGRRDILFREHLYIEPFAPKDQGIVYGTIEHEDYYKTIPVSYQLVDDYILAYAIDV